MTADQNRHAEPRAAQGGQITRRINAMAMQNIKWPTAPVPCLSLAAWRSQVISRTRTASDNCENIMMQLTMIKSGHVGGYIQGGDPGSWCPHLWTWAVRELGIQSVLDIGCGEGHST